MADCFFISEIPSSVRYELCDMIDASGRTMELGSLLLDYQTLCLVIDSANHQGKSPTQEVLNRCSRKLGTANQLFVAFYKMQFARGMSLLLPYVDKKYHKFMHIEDDSSVASDNEPSSSLITSVKDLPPPSLKDEPCFPKVDKSTESFHPEHSVKNESLLPKPSTRNAIH